MMKLLHLLASLLAVTTLSSGTLTSQTGSLTTMMSGGNSGVTGWVQVFDIEVLHTGGVIITAFDVNCENTRSGGVGSLFTIDVYVTPVGGTYLGNQTNPTIWSQVSTGSGISLLQGTPTPVDVDDFVLMPGKYGIGLYFNGTAMAYTNGNGANQSHSNADLKLDFGSSVTGFFGGTIWDPRVWNGTVHYIPGQVGFGPYGDGCAGTGGVPEINAVNGSFPRLGMGFITEITNLPGVGTPVIVGIGASRTMIGAIPLPLDLGVIGMAGCSVWTSTDVTAQAVSTGTTAQWPLLIPNSPSLNGVRLHMQAFVIDPGANALGITTSRPGTAYLGL